MYFVTYADLFQYTLVLLGVATLCYYFFTKK